MCGKKKNHLKSFFSYIDSSIMGCLILFEYIKTRTRRGWVGGFGKPSSRVTKSLFIHEWQTWQMMFRRNLHSTIQHSTILYTKTHVKSIHWAFVYGWTWQHIMTNDLSLFNTSIHLSTYTVLYYYSIKQKHVEYQTNINY